MDTSQQSDDENKLIAERRAKLTALRGLALRFPMISAAQRLPANCNVTTSSTTRRPSRRETSIFQWRGG